jgi:hypothetical protein
VGKKAIYAVSAEKIPVARVHHRKASTILAEVSEDRAKMAEPFFAHSSDWQNALTVTQCTKNTVS